MNFGMSADFNSPLLSMLGVWQSIALEVTMWLVPDGLLRTFSDLYDASSWRCNCRYPFLQSSADLNNADGTMRLFHHCLGPDGAAIFIVAQKLLPRWCGTFSSFSTDLSQAV